MVYNNVTNALRRWCDEEIGWYVERYEEERITGQQSLRYLSYTVPGELQYKLGLLIDREFPDYNAYLAAVSDLMSFYMRPTLKQAQGKVALYYIRSAENRFREYLGTLSPEQPAPAYPYCRVIRGEETERIANHFFEVWNYDVNYWYPLNGTYDEDKLFIARQWVEPHLKELHRLLGLPQQHIYEYGEARFFHPHCAEVDHLEDYSGSEQAYCPKDFSWIIYYSHENTITFAGTIIPQVKILLHAETEHWNRFEWDDLS